MKVFTTVAAILGILHGSHGYVLDKSCDPYKQMVIDGMSNAFDLAQAGSDTLTQLSPSGSGAVWEAQKDLVSYLFSDALTNGNIDKSSPNWGKVSDIFSAVLKYNNNQGQPQSTPSNYKSLSPDSVVVYCDYSRFSENKDCDGNKKKGYVCDTNIGISWPMNSIYSDCKSTSKLSTTSVEAWTAEFASHGVDRASEIQLCPGFLKTVQSNKVQNLKSQGRSLARGVKKLSSWLDDPFRTAMDVKYTFDATLLHEMTHAIPNAATVDSKLKNSYGWKNCVKMSGSDSLSNADSYAFFGLAARMISPNSDTVAQRPMSDGSVNILPGTSSKRDYAEAKEGVFIGHRAADQEQSRTPSTLRTTPRSSSSTSAVIPSSSAISLSSSAVRTTTSKASSSVISTGQSTTSSASTAIRSTTPKTSSHTNPSSAAVSTGRSSGTASIPSDSVSSQSTPSTGQTSTGLATSSSVSTNPTSTALRSTTSKASSHTSSSSASISTGKSSATERNSSGSISSTPQGTTSGGSTSSTSSTSTGVQKTTTSKGSSPANPSSTTVSTGQSSATLGTITQSSSTTVVPIIVISVSKSGTTTPVTYISTYTSSGSIKPTGAWMCTGSLCDTGSSCIVPLFCSSSSGSSSSWGLCCGWEPPVVDGGSTPAAGGPSPGPPDDDTKPTTSTSQTSTSQTSTSHTTSTSSGSSCSTQTTSACDTSYSVFTPSGATTASTSTFTLSCSTVTGCSVSISASVTTTTGNPVISATPIGDAFNEFDTSATSWYELQQSIFSEAEADTTDPYITWSASSTSVVSSSSSGTTPASTATTTVASLSTGTQRSRTSSIAVSTKSTSSSAASSSSSSSSTSTSSQSSTTTSSTSSSQTSSSKASTTSTSSAHTTSSATSKTSTTPQTLTCSPTTGSSYPQPTIQSILTSFCKEMDVYADHVSCDNKNHGGFLLADSSVCDLVSYYLYEEPTSVANVAFNISLVEGSAFVINSTTCSTALGQVLNGCAPFSASSLDDLQKYGGSVTVNNGTGGVASFVIEIRG